MRHGLVINTMEDVNGKKSYMKKTLVDDYVLIKDLNKFMYNETKDGQRKHFCMYCLLYSTSEDMLNKHKTNCIIIYGKQAIELPVN